MLSLIYCELLKLKKAKIVPISILGTLAVPFLMFFEAIQTHFDNPQEIFTLADIYDNSLVYIMLLMNILLYISVAAYLFSREYAEDTLKTLLPLPLSRGKFLLGKFCTLLIWTLALSCITWLSILLLLGLYHLIFGLSGFSLIIALKWLIKFILASILMFITLSPFTYLAEKSKNFVMPIIVSAVIIMSNAALSNHKMAALFPWCISYLIAKNNLAYSAYPPFLSILILLVVSVLGFLATYLYFKKEDL